MNLYSRIDPTQILHIINRKRDIQPERKDLVEPNEFIQVATINQPAGKSFKPHRHIMRPADGIARMPQESWVVITGLVKVTMYDLDDTILHVDMLEPGDCSITLYGGHSYEFIQPGIVYEFKTGPYNGREQDKVMI